MKLGIIAPSHDRKGIEWVKESGLKYAEFDINGDDISYVTNNVADLTASLDECQVKLGAVGRWGRFRLNNDLTVNEKERQDEYDLIDFCARIGCPVYICGINYVEGFSYYSNITAAINYFEDLVAYSNGRVKICTYNCHWNSYIDKPHEWDIVHDHIKALGIKFDPSHTINGGRDYMDEAVKYGRNFDHVHIKGTVNINGNHVDDPPAGLDTVNWGAFLSVLRHYNYDGMLSIEPHSATWQGELGEKGLAYTVRYMKALLFED